MNREIPQKYKDQLDDYLKHGYRPGPFIHSVLRNDLIYTHKVSTKEEWSILGDVLEYVWYYVPNNKCWSEKKINNWIRLNYDNNQERNDSVNKRSHQGREEAVVESIHRAVDKSSESKPNNPE